MSKQIKEVVVVEGYHDLATLKGIYPQLDIVITNGSEITTKTLEELKKLNETRGLILFLDPDYQGERIRRIINDYVGESKHAFLKKEDCINKNKTKVGIEHANKDVIIKALEKTFTSTLKSHNQLTMKDLFELELIGHKNSKTLRKIVVETIGIGLCNGKTLVSKLNMFNIKKDDIVAILRK